jgi:hypothetical protein
VNFVDEEHFAGREVRHDTDQVARLFDRRTGRRAHRDAHLVRDHVGERRLPEARRSVEQDVIERLASLLGGRDRHLKIFADAILTDVLVEPARTQPGFVLRVFVDACRRHDSIVGHQQS